MQSQRVNDTGPFLKPMSAQWRVAKANSVQLVPTPLGLQPNDYIKVSWEDQQYGLANKLEVASVHDGNRLALRLQWRDASEDRGDGEGFPDGAVVAFPVRGNPTLATMGAVDAPIQALHWSALNDVVRSVQASGIGTSSPGPVMSLSAQAEWRQGVWNLVIIRDLAVPTGAVPLAPGQETRIGFAVWDGGKQERAGVKAFSIDWKPLTLEA